jgi:hypothetical protein
MANYSTQRTFQGGGRGREEKLNVRPTSTQVFKLFRIALVQKYADELTMHVQPTVARPPTTTTTTEYGSSTNLNRIPPSSSPSNIVSTNLLQLLKLPHSPAHTMSAMSPPLQPLLQTSPSHSPDLYSHPHQPAPHLPRIRSSILENRLITKPRQPTTLKTSAPPGCCCCWGLGCCSRIHSLGPDAVG